MRKKFHEAARTTGRIAQRCADLKRDNAGMAIALCLGVRRSGAKDGQRSGMTIDPAAQERHETGCLGKQGRFVEVMDKAFGAG
jgi:hypothetical protein